MFELLNTINICLSSQLTTKLKRLIFAALGGLILSLSLPAVARGIFEPLALVAWIGLVPLFILTKSSNSSTKLSIETIVFGMAYYLAALSWLPELHPLTWQGFSLEFSFLIAAMVWTIPSLFHAALFVPVTLVAKAFYASKDQGQKKNGSLTISDIVFLAFLWTAIQYKLQFNLLGLSILSAPLHYIAYSQHHYLNFIQICNIIGTIGLEFLIVVVNLYISNFFNVRIVDARSSLRLSNYNINQPSFSLHNLPQQTILGLSLAAIFVASISYSNMELAKYSSPHDAKHVIGQASATTPEPINGEALALVKPESNEVSFAVAQANLSAEASRGKKLHAADVLNLMKEKTAKIYQAVNGVILERKDILVWPEGSVPLLISDTLPAELDELKQYADIFVFGTYHVNGSKLYNSNAFVDYFSSNGKFLQFYNKIKLVPFGEYTPWTSVLPDKFKELARFAIGSGFDRGSAKQEVIATTHGRIGTFVCFELLFPDLVRKQAAKSELLINLNDLSWFKSERAEDAFLAVAKFRAIENAQGLILASNRGTSTGIDRCGRLVTDKLQKSHNRSIYNLYGW
jgi:apolipoprotein N-acyltransferase